ncbi:hypothetical protein N7457_006226 [Penicillium paradoxum]|uniref:uncharacterized protein n=1 Tax=Penicillium paradoxum TaxID=176176 RepID=UPI002546B09E|nr:uncharacterized protein N7457_006226 [Penicillium paradoxum]KAJ5781066.1 hypothetical protein N7457_006226 [Penicillium paradoxum]
MKSFALAALLASTAMALPANIASGTTGTLPSDLPSCLPSGVVPSGIPSPVASLIPTCSDAPASSSALPIPTGATPELTQGSAGPGQVLSILNQAGTSDFKMKAESELEKIMSKLPTHILEKPVGKVIQTADSVDLLDLNNGSGLTKVTAVLDNGKGVLIELTAPVVDLLHKLGLGEVGNLVGSIVGGVENILGSLKRSNSLENVVSITDVNGLAGGKDLVVQLDHSVLGLLSGLDLATLEGPIGNIIAKAPSVSELKSKIPKIPGADFIAVNAEDKASVLLIKVDGAVQGLLSTLGLGSLGAAVGSIVSDVKGALTN